MEPLPNQQITKRINRLVEAAHHIAQGDLTIQVEENETDEFGNLEQAFNQMVKDLSQLHESRELLSRTMSPAIRQSLIENGLDFRSTGKIVSVLFIDIRNFTQLIETHDTKQVFFLLNDFYTTIINQVHISDGIVGKYAGDSVLAFFGAPEARPPQETSVKALLTALALQDAVAEVSDRWVEMGMPSIQIGMGITIGPVIAGPIGSAAQFEYTIIGDAVNLAARLQSLTRSLDGFDIILSREVYDSLSHTITDQVGVIDLDTFRGLEPAARHKHFFNFVDLGEVLVKGKRDPVWVYGFPERRPPALS
jgi:class 3 adenylate cyclase